MQKPFVSCSFLASNFIFNFLFSRGFNFMTILGVDVENNPDLLFTNWVIKVTGLFVGLVMVIFWMVELFSWQLN